MKIWTAATDSQFGTETHTFLSEEEFNDFMHDFLGERWPHEPDDMPDDWNDMWDAMGNSLSGSLDSFQTGEIELYDHPVVEEAARALQAAQERLGQPGDDDLHRQLSEVLVKLLPPPPPAALSEATSEELNA